MYKDLNCSREFKNEKDEDWSKVQISFDYFKCARLKTDYSETYLVNNLAF